MISSHSGSLLQLRDEEILLGLGKYRFLTSDHVRMLYFPENRSKTPSARRLQRLVDEGYISYIPTVNKQSRSKGVNCYFLTQKGFDYLVFNRGFQGYFYKKNKDAGLLFLEHTLACIDFRIKTESDINGNHLASIEEWFTQFDIKNPEATSRKERLLLSFELYDDLSRKNFLLLPDDLFILRGKGEYSAFRTQYFVEIDRNTEATSSRLREKFRKYHLFLGDYKYREFLSKGKVRLLFVTTSLKKCTNIIETLGNDSSLSAIFPHIFFSDYESVHSNNLFTDSIWVKSNGEFIPLIK